MKSFSKLKHFCIKTASDRPIATICVMASLLLVGALFLPEYFFSLIVILILGSFSIFLFGTRVSNEQTGVSLLSVFIAVASLLISTSILFLDLRPKLVVQPSSFQSFPISDDSVRVHSVFRCKNIGKWEASHFTMGGVVISNEAHSLPIFSLAGKIFPGDDSINLTCDFDAPRTSEMNISMIAGGRVIKTFKSMEEIPEGMRSLFSTKPITSVYSDDILYFIEVKYSGLLGKKYKQQFYFKIPKGTDEFRSCSLEEVRSLQCKSEAMGLKPIP